MELPFVEAIAKVCLAMLLTIRQEVKPVLEDFSYFDELAPPVKHFGLEVVVSAIPVLPASYRLG